MNTLDLTDNLLLVIDGGRLFIEDRRPWETLTEGDCFVREAAGAEEGRISRWGVYLIFEAGRFDGEGNRERPRSVRLESPHAVYAHKVLEGTAAYEDGTEEAWRIQIDPVAMRVHWNREPLGESHGIYCRFFTPATGHPLQRWFTPEGWRKEKGPTPRIARLADDDTGEVVFLSRQRRNVFRLEATAGGPVSVQHGDGEIPGHRLVPPVNPPWVGEWRFNHASIAPLVLSLGVAPALRDAAANREIVAVDCGQDFGEFYHYIAAPFVLGLVEGKSFTRRALQGPGANAPLTLEELAWTAECLPYWSPDLAKAFVREALEARLDKALHPVDAPFLLLLAGRYRLLAGDGDFLAARLPRLQAAGQAILDARRPSEALPLRPDPSGGAQKDPYFAALCHEGLLRLRRIETDLGHEGESPWETAAEALQLAAVSPFEDGGLWHGRQHTFIKAHRFLDDYGEPLHDTVFSFRDNIAAFALGLHGSPERLREAYEWIDSHYTYATGRGGATFPPRMERMFFALLDIIVRKRYGIGSVNRLLHRAVDTAFSAPVPFPTAAPDQWGGSREGGGMAMSGAVLDNSAYFALVVGVHYGLAYTHRGWEIGNPNPLSYYRLTRITGLRHGHGTYAVSWQGQGAVSRVLLDGRPLSEPVLGEQEGDHEVLVILK